MNTFTENTDWIGAWIRDARKHWGRSQEALGEAMALTKGNISAWENNRHSPSIQQLTKISELTGYSLPDRILSRMSLDMKYAVTDHVPTPTATLSPRAIEIAKAFDRLQKPAQRAAVIAQLEAFGVLDVDGKR
jgi:transcriptional regulator with XRE-family HTH domain